MLVLPRICSRHDIAEILLKLALNTNQSIKSTIQSMSPENEKRPRTPKYLPTPVSRINLSVQPNVINSNGE